MLRRILTAVKIAIPLLLIFWLITDIRRNDPETFARLRDQPKEWGRLLAACLVCMAATCIGFVRWFFLVRALNIPFRLRDAFRLGFIGYVLNFVSLGTVGGDLFKALFLAREQKQFRLEAVATIAVDRIIGLFGLLLLTSIAIGLIDLTDSAPEIQFIAKSALVASAAVVVVFSMIAIPTMATGRISGFITELPWMGPSIRRLIEALRVYRRKKRLLCVLQLMSIAVHACLAVAVFLAAGALFPVVPSLSDHFIICQFANVVAALPISPSGVGTYEVAMRFLYDNVPGNEEGVGKGLVVALCYRALQISVASIGACFYWLNRKRVETILSETNELDGDEESTVHVECDS